MQDPMAAAFQTIRPPQFPEQEQHLRCPRCDSTNTKFCYYNNYNLSQPRHFCKNCRRYWTKGGALRNIPVGGGTRKNSKRRSSSPSSSSSTTTTAHPKRSNNPSTPSAAAAPPLQIPTESISALFPPAEQDRQMLDITGSFSSLLASNGHFGNLLESFHPGVLGPPSSNDLSRPIGSSALELHSPSNGSDSSGNPAPPPPQVPENFLGLHGDSSCWNGGNGWPDLSIYTPGSSFQWKQGIQ